MNVSKRQSGKLGCKREAVLRLVENILLLRAKSTILVAAIIGLLAGSLFVATPALSEEAPYPKLREAIATNLPDLEISSISKSPLDGIYELISSGQIYYLSEDAKFVFDGELINLESRVNLTAQRLGSLHIELINAVDETEMLIYEPEEPSERSITVFTDTSCGYCRKLHAELDTLLEGGVRVRYLMFPRAGLNSPSSKDLESIWCSDDPQEAMTISKSGGKVPSASCSNPIESHMAIAEQVGLRGTPLIYLDTGQQIPGYRAAAELVRMVQAGVPAKTQTQ